MAYVVKSVTVKPAGVQWFGQANPVANQRFIAWARSQSGVLSAIGRPTDPNTFEATTVFADKAAYDAFTAAAASNADAQARQAYANASGFQTTVTIME
jgi:hypothetical protein